MQHALITQSDSSVHLPLKIDCRQLDIVIKGTSLYVGVMPSIIHAVQFDYIYLNAENNLYVHRLFSGVFDGNRS